MKDEISMERLNEMQMKSGNDDEYTGMTWGSREDIQDLLNYIFSLKEELKKSSDERQVISYCGISLEKLNGLIRKIKEFHPEWLEDEKGVIKT